jgi:4-coumarate--CoA ligase
MTSYYWLVGLNNLIFRTLHVQKRLITSKPFTPDLFIGLIEKYEINASFLITSYLSLLTESPRFKAADFSRLKYLKTGGMYVSEDLRRTVRDKLTNGIIIVGYGMTEFCGLLAETPHDCQISSSVGVPSINTDVKIQLDDGTTGYLGEIGEILARNPVSFSGYYRNRHRAKFDDEGWLHTGNSITWYLTILDYCECF